MNYSSKGTMHNFGPSEKMITTWHQQVFALDAKYNSQRVANHPPLGIIYMRRRSQLLREKNYKDPKLQNHYLKIRSELLRRRYGTYIDTSGSLSERSFEVKQKPRIKSSIEGFIGVHHVFDQHKNGVSMLKFANNEKSKFCCASLDGTISICEATTVPPKVYILKGHTKGVTAIDWSMSNDLLVSSSLDTTVRLWKISSESKVDCLRIVCDQLRAECLTCAFVPTNNNLVIVGNSQGLLQIINISTGKFPRNGSAKVGGKITSLTCQASGGNLLWAGNDRGMIVSFRLEPGTGKLSRLKRMEGAGGFVTSLSWRLSLSRDFPWPSLLVSSSCNAVLLFRVKDEQGFLSLWKKYPVKHKHYFIKSTFSPQTEAALIATGSEDGSIHLLECTRDGKSARVNRLLGHSAPTTALSFNSDESLLATADQQGLVILWKNNQL